MRAQRLQFDGPSGKARFADVPDAVPVLAGPEQRALPDELLGEPLADRVDAAVVAA